MLRKWSLTNFKSFKGKTELELAPITVLAGANSSGKSTIIQSILLLKQTLQYVPATRAVGLNGPLIKLGKFEDIKNISSNSETIEIGWELDELSSYRPTSLNSLYFHSTSRPNSVAFSITFGLEPELAKDQSDATPRMTPNLRQLQPSLLALSMAVNFSIFREGKEQKETATLVLRRSKEEPDIQSSMVNALPFQVASTDPASRKEMLQQRPESKLVGANLRHFFPSQIGVSFNKTKDFARKFASVFVSSADRYTHEAEFRSVTLAEPIIERLLNKFEDAASLSEVPEKNHQARFLQRLKDIPRREMLAFELIDRINLVLRTTEPRLRSLVRTNLVERQDEIERIVGDSATLPEEPGYDIGLPRIIATAADQTGVFFQNSVRYLGPLRDEPRPVYPLEALVNLTDVGYRGEHTAAVLDLHKDRPVVHIPSRFSNDLINGTRETVTLHSAVVDWLSYLGVAEGVRTEDMGMIGHQLQVRTGDVERDHDLTNVGVGVSQLLPIIVMALLAPSPSLLIFEQPELHLHPKVQARLADFFVSLGLVGRQCILETHSEYLVDRLRRRIAEAEGEKLNAKIKIYFTQKVSGNTQCRPVTLTAYGAIIDWPADFFDQSNAETELILSAAQKKLKVERDLERRK